MSEHIIETMLVLFWAGYAGLNLWLWRIDPLEQANDQAGEFNETEGAAT